jgi:hypothetical protein
MKPRVKFEEVAEAPEFDEQQVFTTMAPPK